MGRPARCGRAPAGLVLNAALRYAQGFTDGLAGPCTTHEVLVHSHEH